MKRFFNLQTSRQVKTFLHMFKFSFVGKNNESKMKNKFNQISNSFSHHFKSNCRCWVVSMPDKCCVFNCRLNNDNGPKETVFSFPDEKKDYDIESIRLDLWTERAGNRRRNHVYICRKHFLNRITIKRGTEGKRR